MVNRPQINNGWHASRVSRCLFAGGIRIPAQIHGGSPVSFEKAAWRSIQAFVKMKIQFLQPKLAAILLALGTTALAETVFTIEWSYPYCGLY